MTLAVDLQERATDALLQWRGREVFPTDLGSAEIRGFSRELRMRSIFSARVTNAEFLAEIGETVDDILAGKINMADGRLRLFRKLRQLGYDPEIGFPDDMAAVPPAERGSLRDLSSEARLQLILETNTRIAANYGLMVQGNTEYARFAYPAWELVRLYNRIVPRGSAESRTAGWQTRWEDAGDAVEWEGAVKAPMIARKDSPIWQALGSGAGGYQDTLDNPFPPFAFGSGMAWRQVPRAQCLQLGLIEPDETPARTEGTLTPAEETVTKIVDKMPADLREVLEREFRESGERLRKMQEQELQRDAEAGFERKSRMMDFWRRAAGGGAQ